MATIEASIKITDKASPTINKMNKALDNAINHCEKLESASTDMINTNAIKSANDELTKTAKKFKQIENNVGDVTSSTEKFRGAIKGLVTAFAGIAIVKKSIDMIKNSIQLAAEQTNAELQLKVVLANAGSSKNAFDEITKKASQIQSRGIFGDEAMIAGAAEFATYVSDKDAITTMMESLSNYAIGMSGGSAVNTQEMVNYATNLGKIMNGSFDAMTKKGFKFTEAQKAIIDGTATQAQYVEVLGKDYENMTEDMRKAMTINSVITESWGNLYDTMSNTPQGKITQLKNAWGDVLETVGNKLAPSITAFFDTIKQNMPQITNATMGLANAFNFVLDVLSSIMSVAGSVVGFFQEHWSQIGIVITTVTALLAAFALGLNSIWLVGIAIIGLFYQITDWIGKAFNKSINATGILASAFVAFGVVIWNTVAYIWNYWANFVEWFANAFKHPILSTQILFSNLLSYLLGVCADITSGFDSVATNITNAMISAINFIIRAWNKVTDVFGGVTAKFGLNLSKGTEINKVNSITSSLRQMSESQKARANSLKPADYWSAGKLSTANLNSAMANAYNWGAGLGNRIQQAIPRITAGTGLEDSLNEIANNTGSTAANTGAINNTLSATDEDLKYLRELAERDVINRFTTAEIKVDMTNNNSISSDMDIDGVVRTLTQKLNEQLATQVEGVYA